MPEYAECFAENDVDLSALPHVGILGMPEYAGCFAENDVDLSALPHLTDHDLKELGISLAHRRKMLAAIAEAPSLLKDAGA